MNEILLRQGEQGRHRPSFDFVTHLESKIYRNRLHAKCGTSVRNSLRRIFQYLCPKIVPSRVIDTHPSKFIPPDFASLSIFVQKFCKVELNTFIINS